MADDIDCVRRKALADAMRIKLNAHREALEMEKKPEVKLPYDGKPLGFRKAPNGYTEALLKSEIVTRPLPARRLK